MRHVAAAALLATLSFAPAPREASVATLPSARDARVDPSARDARGQSQKVQSLPSARVDPSARESRVPFSVGETLSYDVSWSSYFTAGEATATVRERKPGASGSAYYIVADGRPVGLVTYLVTGYYKVDTLLGATTLAPERGSIFLQENGRQQYKVSNFNQAKHSVDYEVTGRAPSPRHSFRIPPNTQDFLSALYVIRTMVLKPGATMQMNAFDSGELYRVRVTGGAIESVRTGAGAINAQRIGIDATTEKGERVGQNLAVWISSDARRLPVMLSADLPVGSFRLTLRGVK